MSKDGVAAIDVMMPDGASEDYPITLEEADASDGEWTRRKRHVKRLKKVESTIERVIFDCRFFALMGVVGSLIGSFLCFVKGCFYVYKAIIAAAFDVTHGLNSYKVVLKLIEALDTYLVATVMLIFGMGLYELFVNELEAVATTDSVVGCKSNLFGLFRLRERPKWLQINGLDALKEKLGHVIVMILLVGMFEKSKKVPIRNGVDLVCVATSVLLCAGSLYLLSQLSKNGNGH
ncbi:hypothetical protein KFL_001940140 [Klebsormidium nitens]|uniref:Uncharacterized protein n=1 Tax=Klebsormidium nitens TaxID=105231 RepID=A0A1Y1I756_KLENI|nr:hypothetical protein KFL_001940140 [Klebsormidium nitens]|eukprot:GAQ84557.1 hypothetical protein KFL_001940140 [Klebsormidium nitens]